MVQRNCRPKFWGSNNKQYVQSYKFEEIKQTLKICGKEDNNQLKLSMKSQIMKKVKLQ